MRALHEREGEEEPRAFSLPSKRTTPRRFVQRTFRLRPSDIQALKDLLDHYNDGVPRTMQMSLDELARVVVLYFLDARLGKGDLTELRNRAS